MPSGELPPGNVYSVATPDVVILPTVLLREEVYQRFPSGPDVIPLEYVFKGRLYSVIAPAVVILPTPPAPVLLSSVYQRFLSEPCVIALGASPPSGSLYSVIAPAVVILPILYVP